MAIKTKAEKILRKKGWRVVRSKKHKVFKCNCGAGHIIVMAMSRSDQRAEKNQMRDLRRIQCPSLNELKRNGKSNLQGGRG
jgi:hypothetical protein